MSNDAKDSEDGMAPVENGEEGESEGKKKGFLSKKLIIIVVGAVVLLGGGGGAGAYFMGYFDTPSDSELAEVEQVEEVEPPVFFDLPDMTVNLAGAQERSQYLRLEISLEVANDEILEKVKPFLPRVVDTFQVYLRELRMADLEGSAGIFRLKEELLRRINLAVYPSRVDDVLFRKLLVQ